MRRAVLPLLALAVSLLPLPPLRADLPLGLNLLSDVALQSLVGKPAPELSFLVADGSTKSLADYHGRWVFLSFSATWCPPSENVGIIGSEIAEELKDRPFDFIQVSFAPSVDDVVLATLHPFQGVEAVPTAGENVAAWKCDTVPANYLIDPDGNVVFANHAATSKSLRATLFKALREPLSLPPDFAAIPTARQAEEDALLTRYRKGSEDALPLFRAVLGKEPESPWARGWFSRCLLLGKEDGLTRDAWLAREMEDPAKATDPLRFLLLTQKIERWRFDEAAPLLPPLLAKYPQSVVLQAYRIHLAKRPVETTREELLVLLAAQPQFPPYEVRLHALLAAETLAAAGGPGAEGLNKAFAAAPRDLFDHDLPENAKPLDALAHALFQNKDWGRELLAGYDARHGRAEDAADLVSQLDDGLTPETTTDRNAAANAAWRHVAILDWKGALPYAAKHTQTTPWNALGGVIRLVAALRAGDGAAKEAAWNELLNFKTDRKAYLYAQKVMRGEAAATDDEIAALKGDPYAFVALLWANAALEYQGKPADALAAFDRELRLRPLDDTYAILFTLRDALRKANPAVAGS